MRTSNRHLNTFGLAAAPLLAMCLLSGCGGISAATKERVAQTETAVQQAQSTLGNAEAGALELQRAREHLAAAKTEMENGNEGQALRHANEAQLKSELAIAKAQSATARKAAEEMLASIETLRKEAARPTVAPDQPR